MSSVCRREVAAPKRAAAPQRRHPSSRAHGGGLGHQGGERNKRRMSANSALACEGSARASETACTYYRSSTLALKRPRHRGAAAGPSRQAGAGSREGAGLCITRRKQCRVRVTIHLLKRETRGASPRLARPVTTDMHHVMRANTEVGEPLTRVRAQTSRTQR